MSKLTDYIDERRLVQLPDGTPAERIEALLDRPDAREYVQAVDAPVLYQLIKDAGWGEAEDLIGYVSTEQLQIFVDLDCWRRDVFDPRKLEPWMAAVLSETDDRTFRAHCRDTDPEVLALYFKDSLLVGLFDEEGMVPPEFYDKDVAASPDGVYALVYPEDENSRALLNGLINRLYETDMVLAWTLLEAVRWELRSPMEEEAYRWRNSRLEEYGFVEFDEAMRIYRPLDPVRFRERIDAGDVDVKSAVDGPQNLPVLSGVADEGRYFAAAMIQRLEGESLQTVMAEFVALQNRALIAEGAEPSEAGDAQPVAERTTGYLSIGLEFLSRRNDERAVEILQSVHLRDVFRAGFTSVEKLRDNVARIRRRPTLTLVERERFSLLRAADAALCDAILRPRPMFAEISGDRDSFHTQDQVDRAALRLGLIAFKQLWLFGVMSVSPGELVQRTMSGLWLSEAPDLTFDAFFATALAQVLVERPPDTFGLRPGELNKLPALLRAKPWGDDAIGFFEPVVGPVLEELPAGVRLVGRWLETALAELHDELAAVSNVDTPELFRGLLVLQTDASKA